MFFCQHFHLSFADRRDRARQIEAHEEPPQIGRPQDGFVGVVGPGALIDHAVGSVRALVLLDHFDECVGEPGRCPRHSVLGQDHPEMLVQIRRHHRPRRGFPQTPSPVRPRPWRRLCRDPSVHGVDQVLLRTIRARPFSVSRPIFDIDAHISARPRIVDRVSSVRPLENLRVSLRVCAATLAVVVPVVRGDVTRFSALGQGRGWHAENRASLARKAIAPMASALTCRTLDARGSPDTWETQPARARSVAEVSLPPSPLSSPGSLRVRRSFAPPRRRGRTGPYR